MPKAQKPEFVKQGDDVLVSVLVKKEAQDAAAVTLEQAAHRAAQELQSVAHQEQMAMRADAKIAELQNSKLNRAKFK